MAKVTRYELCDLGIDNSQYFPGFGTSGTGFTESALGVGDDPREALDDVLEQMAFRGVDVSGLERMILARYPDLTDADDYVWDWDDDDDDDDDEEMDMHLEDERYYIGIRFDTSP